MSFAEILGEYLKTLDMSSSQLAEQSGLNISTVNRYRSGKREPSPEGDQLHRIALALSSQAGLKGISLTSDEISSRFYKSLTNGLSVDYSVYLRNLNRLVSELDIKSVTLAKVMAYDPSHISKILSGQRRPGDIGEFNRQLGQYIAQRTASEEELSQLAELTGCSTGELNSERSIQNAVAVWLGNNVPKPAADPFASFLSKLDSFDLEEFIKTIKFNDIKLPTAAFQLPTTKFYTGISAMKESEIDFIRATVLSKSKEDCIMFSNMPIEKMSEDSEFAKKWMFGMAMLLKKGLHLHIIHDVDRPFGEMMIGLEANIPLYMTGQISPYYFPSPRNANVSYLLKTSGAAALEGTAVKGYHASGKYVLTKNKEEVRVYGNMAKQLLSKAAPLMDIYTGGRMAEFSKDMKLLLKNADLRTVSSTLPLWTISEKLLDSILRRCDAGRELSARIRSLRTELMNSTEELLKSCRLHYSAPEYGQEEFQGRGPSLMLPSLSVEKELCYSYDEYKEHMEQTRLYAANHPGMSFEPDPSPAFRNLSYTIVGDDHVVVSKTKSPAIHFVIHHKNMVRAFKSFVPPITE